MEGSINEILLKKGIENGIPCAWGIRNDVGYKQWDWPPRNTEKHMHHIGGQVTIGKFDSVGGHASDPGRTGVTNPLCTVVSNTVLLKYIAFTSHGQCGIWYAWQAGPQCPVPTAGPRRFVSNGRRVTERSRSCDWLLVLISMVCAPSRSRLLPRHLFLGPAE